MSRDADRPCSQGKKTGYTAVETLSFYVHSSLVTGSKSAILCWNKKHLKSIASSGEANDFVQEAKQACYYEHSAPYTSARSRRLPAQGQGCGSMLTITQTCCSSPCPRISAPPPPSKRLLWILSQEFYSTVTIVNIFHQKAATAKGNEKIRHGSLIKRPGISSGPEYQILWSPEFGIFISFLCVLGWIQQYRRGG